MFPGTSCHVQEILSFLQELSVIMLKKKKEKLKNKAWLPIHCWEKIILLH